jgi:hypothetical protein
MKAKIFLVLMALMLVASAAFSVEYATLAKETWLLIVQEKFDDGHIEVTIIVMNLDENVAYFKTSCRVFVDGKLMQETNNNFAKKLSILDGRIVVEGMMILSYEEDTNSLVWNYKGNILKFQPYKADESSEESTEKEPVKGAI